MKVFNYDVDESQPQPANSQDFEPTFYVPIPADADGNPSRSGYVPMQLTSNIIVQGSGTCVGGGAGFGVNATFGNTTPLRLPVATGDLLDFPSYQLVVHRRGSPLGSGWAFNDISTLYRSPDGLSADIVHGNGQQEAFHPYPVLDSAIPNPGFGTGNSLAVDIQTGEILWARSDTGIRRIDRATGTHSSVFSGSLFGGRLPADFKVTYVAGARRFLGITTLGLFEIASDGTSRQLATFGTTASNPSVAGVGHYAYFATGIKLVGNNNVESTTLSRVDLSDPSRTVVDITPATAGDLRFDPHGEVHAQDFQFLRPSGLAPAFDGGLYVSDDRRHAVYHLAADDAGDVGPNSFVTRVLGSGSDTVVVGPGAKMPAIDAAIRQPGALATAPDGVLYVKADPTLGGLLAFDPIEQTARWVAFDSSSTKGATDSVGFFSFLSFRDGPLAPLAQGIVILPSGTEFLQLSTQLSSQYDPTRTLTFSDAGATVLDTDSDVVEQYSWRVGKSEALLIGEAHRSGEPIRSLFYKDLDRLDYIQDPVGGRVTFGYDTNGHLSTVTDPAERVTHFNVDGTGNLREVIYPSGEARRFDYQDYRMTSATHPNGEASTYTYRPDGTLETAKRPGGGTTTVMSGYSRGAQYDATGHIYYESLITDDRGVQHALSTNAAGAVVADKYTADGQAYDVENVYQATLGSGSATSSNRLLRFAETTVNGFPVSALTTFDSLGRAVSVAQSAISNGMNQGMWGLTFGTDRRPTRLAFGEGGIDWKYNYDAAGHLIKVFDVANTFGSLFPPTGRSTTYDGFRTQDGQPTTVTAHGIATALGYDSFGLVNSATDTVGRSMSATHDSAGNAIVVGDGATTLQYGYDPAGRVTSITDAENNVASLGYQAAGCSCSNGNRVTSIVTPDLAADQKWAMTYDADGDLHTMTTPLGEVETYNHNAQRDLETVIDRANRPTSFTYDQLGRKTSLTDPVGRLGTFAYSRPTAASWSGPTLYAQSATASAAPVSLTAALADGEYQVGTNGFQPGHNQSHIALYRDATFQSSQWLAFDALDRLKTRQDRSALGLAFDSTVAGPFHNAPLVDEYLGWIGPFPVTSSKMTDDGYSGGYWSAALDRNPDFDLTRTDGQFLGKVSSFPMPKLDITRDTAGRLKGVMLGLSSSYLGASTIGYKPNGKLESVSLSTPFPEIQFTGPLCTDDTDGNCVDTRRCQSPPGSLQKRCGVWVVSYGATAENFQYNARGLVFTRQLPIASGVAQYNYDHVGRNLLLVYPDGHQRVQVFDALGRLTSRCYQYTDGTPDHCYTAKYDAVGNPKVLKDPDMRLEITYDDLDRVTEVRRYVPPNATTPAYTETYAYNALGAFSIYDGAVVDDQRPRLTGGGKASAGIPASFHGQAITLDGGGRVTNFNNQTFQYFQYEHALQTLTNTTTNTKQTYVYDGLQRLTDVHTGPPNDAKPTSDDTYVYSDLSSSIAGLVTTPHTNNTRPLSPDTPTTQFHVGYDGVDHPLWMTQGGVLLYYELDAIGNVRRLHGDSAGNWPGDFGGYSYTAFGKTITVSDPGGVPPPPMTFVQPFQWQGKRLMAPGLYDSRARVWSADLGAFLQPDEYGFLTRGGTLWSWPGQNPYRWRDPSGRFLAEAAGAATAAGEGALAATLAEFAVAGAAGFAAGYFIIGPAVFAGQDESLNAIARAAARDNQGKPNPGEPCKTESSGGGAKGPPLAKGDVAAASPDPRIPQKALDALTHVRNTNSAPPGTRGGREFANDGRGNGEVLPRNDPQGNPIRYREWDVNRYQPGVNRGPERIVTGSNGSAYYTADHYGTFVPIP